MGQASWDEHAARLALSMSRFQLHVLPDWLYALCSGCGFELEQSPPSDVGAFRFEVATHLCPLGPVAPEVSEPLAVLF